MAVSPSRKRIWRGTNGRHYTNAVHTKRKWWGGEETEDRRYDGRREEREEGWMTADSRRVEEGSCWSVQDSKMISDGEQRIGATGTLENSLANSLFCFSSGARSG